MKGTKHGGGRPSHYKDTEQGLKNFFDDSMGYAVMMFDAGKPFSYESWARHLGITRQTLYNYKKRSEEWQYAFRKLEELMKLC